VAIQLRYLQTLVEIGGREKHERVPPARSIYCLVGAPRCQSVADAGAAKLENP